eukprot:6175134-Pleurochrysis_carterae.AAC.4
MLANLGDSCSQRRLAVIDVANGANVHMRLCANISIRHRAQHGALRHDASNASARTDQSHIHNRTHTVCAVRGVRRERQRLTVVGRRAALRRVAPLRWGRMQRGRGGDAVHCG